MSGDGILEKRTWSTGHAPTAAWTRGQGGRRVHTHFLPVGLAKKNIPHSNCLLNHRYPTFHSPMPDIFFGWKKQHLLVFSCCGCYRPGLWTWTGRITEAWGRLTSGLGQLHRADGRAHHSSDRVGCWNPNCEDDFGHDFVKSSLLKSGTGRWLSQHRTCVPRSRAREAELQAGLVEHKNIFKILWQFDVWGIPYHRCSNPGGDCYWVGGRSNLCQCKHLSARVNFLLHWSGSNRCPLTCRCDVWLQVVIEWLEKFQKTSMNEFVYFDMFSLNLVEWII